MFLLLELLDFFLLVLLDLEEALANTANASLTGFESSDDMAGGV